MTLGWTSFSSSGEIRQHLISPATGRWTVESATTLPGYEYHILDFEAEVSIGGSWSLLHINLPSFQKCSCDGWLNTGNVSCGEIDCQGCYLMKTLRKFNPTLAYVPKDNSITAFRITDPSGEIRPWSQLKHFGFNQGEKLVKRLNSFTWKTYFYRRWNEVAIFRENDIPFQEYNPDVLTIQIKEIDPSREH